MLDERIVEAMKREQAGERLPVYIVDQDFVTLGWKKDRITCARTSFKREIRDATQYKVSLPSRDLGGRRLGILENLRALEDLRIEVLEWGLITHHVIEGSSVGYSRNPSS